MGEIFVTRQPIFDAKGAAVGYDVRFRPLSDGGDPLAQCLLSGGLDSLSRGLAVWATADESQLAHDVFLTPVSVPIVAVLDATLEPTMSLLCRLVQLRAAGVQIALDGFTAPDDAAAPVRRLLPHASFVRTNIDLLSAQEFALACASARKANVPMVADRVRDAHQHRRAGQLGAAYFVGPHFANPTPLPHQSLPASTVQALQVLTMARDASTPNRDLEKAIAGDPTLTVQLLRVVNSAAIGAGGITSIGHALRITGRTTLIRWLALAAFASRAGEGGVERELSDHAVRRAYMAQFIAELTGDLDPPTLFLVGLFSMIDAVFRMPLADVLERVAVSPAMRAAVLDREGRMARVLDFIDAYELGLWDYTADVASDLGVEVDAASQTYRRALDEVDALLVST